MTEAPRCVRLFCFSSNYTGTGRGLAEVFDGGLKGERLAVEGTFQRAEKCVALLARRREIASDTTKDARPVGRAKAAGDFLMDWNWGAVPTL